MATAYEEKIIRPGDEASELAHKVNVASYGNNAAARVFPGPTGEWRFGANYAWARHILEMMTHEINLGAPRGMFPIMWATQQTDGAGQKPSFFTLVGTEKVFYNLGWEIIVMCDHDILRQGGFPALMTNFMDLKQITSRNIHLVRAMLKGYGDALKVSELISFTGESAVMPYAITCFCDSECEDQLVLNWAGNCTGIHHIKKYLTGEGVGPNMWLVGFWEPGYRCNGGTKFVDIITELFGPNPEDILKDPRAVSFAEKLTTPSQSYSKTIKRLLGWRDDGSIAEPLVDVAGIYHITGGGLWNKLKLPQGVGAHLDQMMKPADVLLEAQELSRNTSEPIVDWHAHKTFHGGYGMVLALLDYADAVRVCEEATDDGIMANIAGKTTDDPSGEILVQSQFLDGGELSSLRPPI